MIIYNFKISKIPMILTTLSIAIIYKARNDAYLWSKISL